MLPTYTITYVIFLIFTGTAILSTLALFTRQSLLVAYITLGMILGPWGLKLVNNPVIIQQTGSIGIIFLLFLLGLDLQPQNLLHSLRKMSLITLISSLLFLGIGFITGHLFGYTWLECIIIGIIAMFSSTIISLKLLPTTVLHHQHTGELVISILLLQDIIAIAVLLVLEIISSRSGSFLQLGNVLLAFPVLLTVAYIFEKYILSRLLDRFDKIHEYIENNRKKVVVDLAKVEWMNSTGLGILISGYTRLRNHQGVLKLANVTDKIQSLLTITKLVTVFETFDSVEDAIKSFK